MTASALAIAMPTLAAAEQPASDERVDRLFAEWNRPDSPGCTVGIARNGRYVYQAGYGMANLDYDIPNRPGLVYYMGSVSKQFAAAAIALLVLDNRIKLEDDIRKYFPEMPTYQTPITVRHLVHHTSGIRDIYGIMSLSGKRLEDVYTDSQAIAAIARQKELNFKPGDQYLYSNSGYFLLGQLVKRVTGRSLREFSDERMFRPLGMLQTHFHDDPGHVMKMRAMSYEPGNARRTTGGTEEGSGGGYRISYIQNFDKIGAGGLYTTLDDLLKWDENYYTKKLGGEAFHTLVHTRGVLNNGDTLIYAFGNNVSTYRGLRTTEHGGALMGYKAALLRFPDQHFSVMLQCNYGPIDPSRLANQVAELYLGDQMTPARPVASGPPPSRPPTSGTTVDRRLLGTYYGEEMDAVYTIRAEGNQMVLSRPLRMDTLRLTSEGDYQAGDIVLRFQGPAGQPAAFFTVQAGRVRNVKFVRRN